MSSKIIDPITPRHFTPPLPLDILRHWLASSPVICAILNTYTVLVPANETFYIRTLKRCMGRIEEPSLRAVCTDFIHQEAQHGIAHRRYWRNLDAQGYRFRAFEKAVDNLVLRPVARFAPVWLQVSMVSCIEHVNAYLGHEFLSQQILAEADPRMRALMEWHFAEEIEHKCVAFDVLGAISPTYPARLAGFALTVPLFYVLMTIGMLWFLMQDRLLFRRATWKQLWRHLGPGHHVAIRTLRHLRDYLRRSFHPSQLDDSELARTVIARYGAADRRWVVPTARGRPEHQA